MICPNTGRECLALDFVEQAEESQSGSTIVTTEFAASMCLNSLNAHSMRHNVPKLDCGLASAALEKFVFDFTLGTGRASYAT